MARGLSYRERRLLMYHGMPAKVAALAERMTIDEVLEIRAQLRDRGVTPCPAGAEPTGTQLTLGELAQMMRTNAAPAERPAWL